MTCDVTQLSRRHVDQAVGTKIVKIELIQSERITDFRSIFDRLKNRLLLVSPFKFLV